MTASELDEACELARRALKCDVDTAHDGWCSDARARLAHAVLRLAAENSRMQVLVETAIWWTGWADRPPWANKGDRLLFDAIDAYRSKEGK